ncbi:hypothetical protein [Mycolicibacterium elephantis]|uniref:Secreted protein n=1 Tax=Mycolicibacterium elephantis DSM 44368 TaxID=1335622 RepID=A0A439DNV0_9MYCO|nr:hypothetical protein [Mycolicibacterium elephantis]RWA16965.1 hypothetical protein MELE44368_26130 [Mycolicibacterium elephantis DSM 44368]
MNGVITKFQTGVAACAVVAAATVIPATTVQAAPAVPMPAAPVTQMLDFVPLQPQPIEPGDPRSWFQNSLWWIGSANPNPPSNERVWFSFNPFALLPPFLRPFFGWASNLNFQLCFAGLSAKIGPYGSFSVSVGRRC